MKLILSNGYPYPYPENLTEAEQEALSIDAPGNTLEIPGVVHFEMKYTLTVEFKDDDAMAHASQLTRWDRWDYLVLEVPTSGPDGYDHPAIIVGGMAYCGFVLMEDDR